MVEFVRYNEVLLHRVTFPLFDHYWVKENRLLYRGRLYYRGCMEVPLNSTTKTTIKKPIEKSAIQSSTLSWEKFLLFRHMIICSCCPSAAWLKI